MTSYYLISAQLTLVRPATDANPATQEPVMSYEVVVLVPGAADTIDLTSRSYSFDRSSRVIAPVRSFLLPAWQYSKLWPRHEQTPKLHLVISPHVGKIQFCQRSV